MRPIAVLIAAALLACPDHARATDESDAAQGWLSTLEWRCIGPSRGGRAQTCAGVPGDPRTYYMGATGGGVWKTTNAGVSWSNITDGFVGTGSVGAIAVAPSNPNVLYLGMGEVDIRGNFSHGDGVYKSLDAGKTWTHLGLEDTRQIGRIRIHPTDPDIAYVAALGHVFGPNEERGVFRTTDGGATWEKVLYVDDRTGACDLAMHPTNPDVLFAATWHVSRTPWSLTSGGPGSGLWKSTDGGDSWTQLENGLPGGGSDDGPGKKSGAKPVGKVGVSVSPVNPDRVWALVEAEDGGLFVSDDGGASFRRTTGDRNLRQRAWYYTKVIADTQDIDTVYVMNVSFLKSTDGGATFSGIRVPHGDNHDLWIARDDNLRMVNANDGGANVSFDGGETWSEQSNQPTAQFYHVTVDDGFPYRVYGAQQDNSTASISSRNRLGRWERDFYAVGGGESGYIAVEPGNPDIVYAGSYSGFLTRYDHATRTTRNIMVWPENPMGWGAEALDERVQWTFPIVISPHDPQRIYTAGNRLHASDDGGQSWTQISPDLTKADPSTLASSGGPITKDNTGVEYYATIFAVAESPLREGLIWAGSDDGLVHLTTDGGATWTNVTPEGMGSWPLISIVEASPHDPDTAYLAVNRYKMDDFTPYVYRTRDAGASWQLVTDGIDDDAFVRAVREDPERPDLLYAATETGVWVSFDAGDHWRSLQANLPVVPVTDLVVKDDDLVISTQGRSFWILHDLAPLRTWSDAAAAAPVTLLSPIVTWRSLGDSARIQYHLAAKPEGEVTLELLDRHGAVIKRFAGGGERGEGEGGDEDGDGDGDEDGDERESDGVMPAEAGMNLFRWDLRYPDAIEVEGALLWGGSTRGPQAPPGSYTARLTVGDAVHEATFEVRGDPRLATTIEDYEEQFQFRIQVRDRVSDAHRAVNTLRDVRRQIEATVEHAREHEAGARIADAAQPILAALQGAEDELIQHRAEAFQDLLNFPIQLNNRIASLDGFLSSDFPVPDQWYAVLDQLSGELDAVLARLDAVLEGQVPEFNAVVRAAEVPAVMVDDGGE